MSDLSTAVAEPELKPSTREKRKRQPRYHVILWDDDSHSFEYVMRMLRDLFAIPLEDGFRVAKRVDTSGLAVCLTTTLEHAELKRDQIRAYGADPLSLKSAGSMRATIEPVPGD